jgi:hypothetical protein
MGENPAAPGTIPSSARPSGPRGNDAMVILFRNRDANNIADLEGREAMPTWRLIRPPAVKQGYGYKCWAAALESWCAVTPGRQNWTQEELLQRRNEYTYDPKLPEGAINAVIFKQMLLDPWLRLNMEYKEEWRSEDIDQLYFYELLYERGYLYIVYTATENVRHANVIWAADNEGNASVMDPMRGTYMNKAIEEFKPPFLVAWASKEYFNPYGLNPY